MSNYVIVKLLKTNMVIPAPITYGDVEIRNNKNETEQEIIALKESISDFDLDININECLRMVVSVDSEANDFMRIADIKFEESMDIINFDFFMDENILYPTGYFFSIEDLNIRPLIRNKKMESMEIGNVYKISQFIYEPVNENQYILTGERNDLKNAYIRAANWVRKANSENILYLKFLYRWIAFEALCKTSDEDNIPPKLCLVLGFPSKRDTLLFDNKILLELNQFNKYKYWRGKIRKTLEDAREYRNKIVHNGFRSIEVDENKLIFTLKIMDFVVSNLFSYMKKAILLNLNDLKEVWEIMPIIVSENYNLKNYVIGTMIYLLEHDEFVKRYSGVIS